MGKVTVSSHGLMYNCSASRPKIESKTNTESKEVQTETLSLKARPLANGLVKAKTGDSTKASAYNNWYKKVYQQEQKYGFAIIGTAHCIRCV